jgi:hypothetical protein
MTNEGALTLALDLEGGHVADVQVSSTRRTDFSAVLAGRDVNEALTLVPSLFSVCASAHAVAALNACEAALGVEVDEAQARLRRLLTQLEALDNHGFQVCVAWAKHAGVPPDVEALRRLRQATEALRLWAHGGTRWARLGGIGFTPSGPPTALLAALHGAVDALAPPPTVSGDVAALRKWIDSSTTPVAALLREVFVLHAEGFGKSTLPLLPRLDAAWFAQHLVGPDFGAHPALDSGAAESGALSRVAELPAVAPLVGTYGHAVLPRLLAALVDLRAVADEVSRDARALVASPGHAHAERAGGTGAGIADTSRGRLAHAVELDGSRVVHWRQVAPTEWSFHPFGVLKQALTGAPADELFRRATLLVLALDPCVPCRVVVED